MRQLKEKIEHIFLPFLWIALGFLVVYTFLDWFFVSETAVVSPREEVTDLWLPFLLPWIPVGIWLRPRIRLLNFVGKRGNIPFAYHFVAVLAIWLPTMFAQPYVRTAFSNLVELQSISDFRNANHSKFYAVRKSYVDKRHSGVYRSADVSGRHNNYLNLHIYVVCPLFDSPSDTTDSFVMTWVGYRYQEQISNNLAQADRQRELGEFNRRCYEDFARKDVKTFEYLDRIGNNDKRTGFEEAAKSTRRCDPSEPTTIFEPKLQPFDERTGDSLNGILFGFAVGVGVWLLMLFKPSLDETALNELLAGRKTQPLNLKGSLQIFLPRANFFVTPLLIDVNVTVFLAMVFAGLGVTIFRGKDLLAWGANFGPLVAGGDWWRLLTSMFLHGGILHLMLNMYALMFVGLFLEPVLGRTKFLLAYLVCGLLASLASAWWNVDTVSVGASGAIFGMYGVFLALLTTPEFPKTFRTTFFISTSIFVGYNLLMGLSGGIDNAAHIGGLAGGVALGYLLYPTLRNDSNYSARQ